MIMSRIAMSKIKLNLIIVSCLLIQATCSMAITNESQFFDDDSQENIHDLILFVLFGIFIIFVLDTIYRFGRQSKN